MGAMRKLLERGKCGNGPGQLEPDFWSGSRSYSIEMCVPLMM